MAVARYYDHDLGEWVLLAAGRDGVSGASSWDDLTGKPATFPPESHDHTIGQVSGLEDELDGKAKTSWMYSSATGGTLVWRREDGTTDFGTPTEADNAANKGYVDSQVQNRTPEIRIVSTIPTSPTPGVVYMRFG